MRLLAILIGILIYGNVNCQLLSEKKSGVMMGSYFEVVAVSDDPFIVKASLDSAYAEIERVEKLISSWDSTSQTFAINKNAGIRSVKVDKELYDLIERSKKVSVLTNGAFDISYAALDGLWHFDSTLTIVPSNKEINGAISRVGYKMIQSNPGDTSIYLTKKGMKIGFGAIGKGYAANRARYIMKQMGVNNGLVNAGGDLIAWGKKADGSPWKVGIADPKKKGSIYSWLEINDGSVVTSGNYERYVMIEGKRYSHIIDPRTGWPVSGLKSVTIISKDAEVSDALATAVFVLGEKKGLELIKQLNDIDCILVNDQDKIIASQNLEVVE